MNIVSLHKQDLQLVIQYLSIYIAIITGLSEELRFSVPTLASCNMDFRSFIVPGDELLIAFLFFVLYLSHA